MDEEEKLLLVRRLLPPLRLTRGRFDGITARDSGGGGAGTRDGYEYILVPKQKGKKNKLLMNTMWSGRENTAVVEVNCSFSEFILRQTV